MAWRKESRHKRGYGSAWDKVRLRILERDSYLCQCDECLGGKRRLRPASEVNHIRTKADGGTDAPENLQSVNAECHKRITVAQRGHKRRSATGLDGWPKG